MSAETQKGTALAPIRQIAPSIPIQASAISATALMSYQGLTATEPHYWTLRSDLTQVAYSPISPVSACTYLGNVVDALKRRLDFTGVYSAYLLGQLSDEEFRSASAEFAFTPRLCDSKVLADSLRTLRSFTKSEFTASELAEIFETSEEQIHLQLPLLPREDATP